MTNDNPYKPGTSDDSAKATAEEDLSGRAAYNIASDTITGLNARKSDNLFQAISILVAMPLFAALGALLARIFGGQELPWYGGCVDRHFRWFGYRIVCQRYFPDDLPSHTACPRQARIGRWMDIGNAANDRFRNYL